MLRKEHSLPVLAALVLLAMPASGQGADDCASAQVISGMGAFTFDNTAATLDGPADCGNVPVRRDVWFRWTAPVDDLYEVRTCGLTALSTRIAVYQGTTCPPTVQMICNDNTCGAQTLVTFPGTAGQEYLIRVGSRQIGASGTGMFEIVPSLICPGMTDDPMEPNDACSASIPMIGNSSTNGLFVRKWDDDWFAMEVPAGGTLDVDLTFTHANGDVDTRLFSSCGGQQLSSSLSGTDNEQISWTNNGACQTVFLRVYHWLGDVNDCTNYDMSISGTGSCTPTQIGSSYCTSNANSSGNAATLSAMGSDVVTDQNLTLTASGAPDDVTGLFFFGNNTAQVPFGQGVRCVRGRVYRMPPFATTGPANGNAAGEASLNVDFTGAVYSAALTPGQMNFQFWFQDTAGMAATFNLTDGIQIQFQ